MPLKTTCNYIYSVIVDGKIWGYVDSETEAIQAMEQISKGLESLRKAEKPYKEYFLERKTNTTTLSCVKKGYIYDGKRVDLHQIEYIRVGKLETITESFVDEHELEQDSGDSTLKKKLEKDEESDEESEESSDEELIPMTKKKLAVPTLLPKHPQFLKRHLT